MADGLCGQGHDAEGKPGAGLWLWTTSALGLNSSHNATPSLEGTNIALLHNAGLPFASLSKNMLVTDDGQFTWRFVNGTGDAAQSSGETDIYLLRSNKTHAEVLVVYDRLPGVGWLYCECIVVSFSQEDGGAPCMSGIAPRYRCTKGSARYMPNDIFVDVGNKSYRIAQPRPRVGIG